MRVRAGGILCGKSILRSSDSTLHGAKTAEFHVVVLLNGGFRSDCGRYAPFVRASRSRGSSRPGRVCNGKCVLPMPT